ncbi:sulfotransferase domain-containing protein [Mycobacterium conspicuum]|jgi:hypothetical protein|uniref:Uncharacterized protein n=1 Tax=Mycobacterium conspicuum TaxID=44010 RepID=A0A1X1SYR4_9MYCO|nr:sulfotransferase domain-containing protein [Mycobacterium conspicuum]ORV36746.1 hypothetical protein AWC00_23970 [Mycobacterium conspicuum]BBZ39212.1 hypothetical protein MCNS_22750 [Mycobacterium conspicuum]
MEPIVPRLRLWTETWLKKTQLRRVAVVYQSLNENVFHCTVQKTASQWVRGILSDPRIYRYCGLYTHRYEDGLPGRNDERTLIERRFDKPFPVGAIASPLYCDYEGFCSIPKPLHHKAFFVTRDPRDVLISWYFSAKISHPLIGDLGRVRQDLNRLSEEDGLLYSLEYLNEVGLFPAQRSWADADAKDETVLMLRYEDLIGSESEAHFKRLFQHCDVRVPDEELRGVLQCHGFEQTSGRRPGQEDQSAHLRKGVAGDWQNHFNSKISARFEDIAGDLLGVWNYR